MKEGKIVFKITKLNIERPKDVGNLKHINTIYYYKKTNKQKYIKLNI